MSFKLGRGKTPSMISGVIKNKMRFGQEAGGDASVPGTPVIRKPLEEGVLGEANMDGTIFVDKSLKPGSAKYKEVVSHEMVHATDMKIGKLAYGDDVVKYNGNIYPRKTINGKDMIIVDGVAKEAGDTGFPWEDDANNGIEQNV